MKTEKYFLGLAVVIGVLCVPVLGEVAFQKTVTVGEPIPDQHILALAGIDNLYVWIVRHGLEPDSHGLVFEELENSITDRLKKTSIQITETDIDKMEPNSTPAEWVKISKRRTAPGDVKNLKFRPSRIPELCIDVDTLYIEHSQQIVFRIRTFLARLVHIENESRLVLKTDVWQSEPVMQAVSAQEMSATLNEVALEQVGVFIRAWQAANPKGVQPAVSEVSPKGGPADANQVVIRQKEPTQPPAKAAATKYLYMASKNSKVFHKSTCTWAKRIKPENLVYYKTREDAINDGKRPCKQCEP